MKLFKCAGFLVFITVFFISCDGIKLPHNIFNASERAVYERQFKGNDSLLSVWKENYALALQNNLIINDGFSTKVLTNSAGLAVGYSLNLQKGDLLIVETALIYEDYKFFVDVFQANSSAASTESYLIKEGKFTTFIAEDGLYKVVVQPEINYAETFPLKIYTQPSLGFPVSGKGNKDIQSFWGASRDGGARNHEGLDIFASRGTPVVAATDGYVLRTGDTGLGGKQVWIRDQKISQSLYYAHLDSVMVNAGQSVKMGDVLGTVGNTGNAEGGAPHLHFGIYTGGGAVDAYPFVKTRAVPEEVKLKANNLTILKASSNLRQGPGVAFDILSNNTVDLPIKVISGNGEWFHIKTEIGQEGFANATRLK